MNTTPTIVLDIAIFNEFGEGHWAQRRYLVHSYDDVLWTNDIEEALQFLRQSLVALDEQKVQS